MPKLSVILTCYNSKKEYLDECILSLLNQTFKDFELLVIDDCSKVSIKELIKEYLEKDDRVKYFRTPKNGGAASARNFGIKKAVGEYLAIMDHDDVADLCLRKGHRHVDAGHDDCDVDSVSEFRSLVKDKSALEVVRMAGVFLDHGADLSVLAHCKSFLVGTCGNVDQNLLCCVEVEVVEKW